MAIVVMTALSRRAAWPHGSIQRGAHVQLWSGPSRYTSHSGVQRIKIAPDTLRRSYIMLPQSAAAL